ncbi:hypothetical protein CLS_06000 [[Clostridium] cf. saccharolyticum K10]|nr:hypothetical protein CLS_06000 [[Clostridium] cf. saccharolyticum K10]
MATAGARTDKEGQGAYHQKTLLLLFLSQESEGGTETGRQHHQ